jgi:hypothetical protein
VTGPLDRLRGLCLALPETTERLSHGEPTWFVRDKKTFVMYADHHHDDRVGFWCAAGPGVRDALLAADPDHYFHPPYVGHRGWLGVAGRAGRGLGRDRRARDRRLPRDRTEEPRGITNGYGGY